MNLIKSLKKLLGIKSKVDKNVSIEQLYSELFKGFVWYEEKGLRDIKDYILDGYVVVDIGDDDWLSRATNLNRAKISFLFDVDIYKPGSVDSLLYAFDGRAHPDKYSLRKLSKHSFKRIFDLVNMERYFKGKVYPRRQA